MKQPRKTWVKAFAVVFFLLFAVIALLLLYDSAENHSLEELFLCFSFGGAAATMLIFLMFQAGRRPDSSELYLNWQDRIPLDLYLVIASLPFFISVSVSTDLYHSLYFGYDLWQFTINILLGLLPMCGIALALSLTLASRIKNGNVFRNTLIYRFFRYCKRSWNNILTQLPMIWRSMLLFGGYVIISALLVLMANGTPLLALILFLLVQSFALLLVWRWAAQWSKIRKGTAEIVGGNTDYKINTYQMLPDLKEHAAQLNNLGFAINHAVEERFKSEHFKAELITNVSHDLKTPLTSIINYVDLLKKENIESPTVQEYLEVLDRKSQRLKKLTEDLVEASKASTGNLTVVKEHLDLVQLVTQAAGEYAEKMEAQHLSLRETLPREPVYVEADGRHLWRILDNLLSNCVKYALEGTRVYLEVTPWENFVALAVKNISREPLNLDPDALMERFVRGDESRTTEGSGLGLSITRSLAELQGGDFQINIDGDLFKAVITLPLARPLPNDGLPVL